MRFHTTPVFIRVFLSNFHPLAGFHVFEQGGSLQLRFDFRRVKDLEESQVLSLVDKRTNTPNDRLGIGVEVRDDRY